MRIDRDLYVSHRTPALPGFGVSGWRKCSDPAWYGLPEGSASFLRAASHRALHLATVQRVPTCNYAEEGSRKHPFERVQIADSGGSAAPAGHAVGPFERVQMSRVRGVPALPAAVLSTLAHLTPKRGTRFSATVSRGGRLWHP